ncbi:MAG: hypothetical protein M1309_04510 [Actinobacteria bacterium]|nr:hypothetical protein [Actinomycetota bacterium]
MGRFLQMLMLVLLMVTMALPLSGCGAGSSGDAPDPGRAITQPIDRARAAAGQVTSQEQKELGNTDNVSPQSGQ